VAPVLAEAGANRVVHDVTSDGLRVTITVDDACLEPVLEEMPGALVSLVKPHGVEAVEAIETEKRAVVVLVEEDLGPSDTPRRYMEHAVSQEMSWAARHNPKVEQKMRALEARAQVDTHR
jgi:hypothetical protein